MRHTVIALVAGMLLSALIVQAQTELESLRQDIGPRTELAKTLVLENLRLRKQLEVVAARCP